MSKHYSTKSDKINKIINICLLIMLALTLAYIFATVFNAYVDYRIDKYMMDNQVWYLLEECI